MAKATPDPELQAVEDAAGRVTTGILTGIRPWLESDLRQLRKDVRELVAAEMRRLRESTERILSAIPSPFGAKVDPDDEDELSAGQEVAVLVKAVVVHRAHADLGALAWNGWRLRLLAVDSVYRTAGPEPGEEI